MLLLFSVLVLALASKMLDASNASGSFSKQSEITMMVLNLANYDDWGDWPNRLRKIGEFILESSVDVIYFSEVRFDRNQTTTSETYMNMAEQIVEFLLTRDVSCKIHTDPAMYYSRDVHGNTHPTEDLQTLWEGLTTITCNQGVKMLTTEEIFLDGISGSSDQNDRIAQYSRFEYIGEVFGSINSHWSNDADDRLLNAEETLFRLAEWKQSTTEPTILVGDLNSEMESPYAPPDSALVQLEKAGWIDVYRDKNPDIKADPGYTLWYQREKRVDYVWANECFYPAIKSVGIIGKRQHDDPDDWWSDHFGLIISVDVEMFQRQTRTNSSAFKVLSYEQSVPTSLVNELNEENRAEELSDSTENELRFERVDQQVIYEVMSKSQPMFKLFVIIFAICIMLFGLVLTLVWRYRKWKQKKSLVYHLMEDDPELLAL